MKRRWCQICRDLFEKSDDVIECCVCPRRFHQECVLNEDGNRAALPDDLTEFKCHNCAAEEEEEVPENEDRCKVCRETEKEESDLLLLCDGCPNSYHMSCLNLMVEPDCEKWYCPECRPSDHNLHDIRRLGRVINMEDKDHTNNPYCYVCQRQGKLLGCDSCTNSFHPNCLPDLDFDSFGEKGEWECPCCRGEDPLLNQAHKRWTKVEMEKQAKECYKSLYTWKSRVILYRNRFLLAHLDVLEPFVEPKHLFRLQRPFREYTEELKKKSRGRLRRVSDFDHLQEYLETMAYEAEKEAQKFVKLCYKSMRHRGGRRMEGRPLREGVNLQPHQEAGVEWLLCSFLTGGAILADEMGLGKTIQTLCFLSCLHLMNITGPHLIVVPLSTVGSWLREIHKFTPHLSVIKICGTKIERMHAMQDRLAQKGLYNIYITTYETIKTEEVFFVETIPRWQCIVLDEAHRIKSQSGGIRHSVDRVSGNMRLLLTGTPLQNNAAELFTLINFMFPDVFKDSTVIEEYFMGGNGGTSNSVKKFGKNDLLDNYAAFKKENLESVRLLLSKVMLRRVKEQTVKLPEKRFHDVWLSLNPVSANWYKSLLDLKLLQEEGVSFKKLLGLVIKLRIVCGHPKGMVSRSTQMEKLKAFFDDESEDSKNSVLDEAIKLRSISGYDHINASAKLAFLDKLLCQLHAENIKFVDGYKEKYEEYRREQAAYKFHRLLEQEEKEQNTSGKKKDKRRKINKLTVEMDGEYKRFLNEGQLKANEYTESGLFVDSMRNSKIVDDLTLKKSGVANENTSGGDKMEMLRTSRSWLFSRDGGVPEGKGNDGEQDVATPNKGENEGMGNEKREESHTVDEENEVQLTTEKTHNEEDKESIKHSNGNSCDEPSEEAPSNGHQLHKLLIFTQFQLILDELEAYCLFRGWKYMRLDGSTNKLIRELDIREFNLKDSTSFVYLISTRAGGLGINLTAANHVILFDEDWNPFVDMQAIDRAHRIGQQRDVHVWKIITEWTVEERMAFRREQKLKLEGMLVHANEEYVAFDQDEAEAPEERLSSEEIRKLMLHGKTAIQQVVSACPKSLEDVSLEECMNRQRQQLPDLEGMQLIESDSKLQADEKEESLVDVAEVMHDEAEEPEHRHSNIDASASPPPRSETGDTDAETTDSGPITKDAQNIELANTKALEEQFIAAGIMPRPRERKKPKEVYTPSDWGQNKETRTIRHETKCFLCGIGKNVVTNSKDGGTSPPEVVTQELINCFRCPRSYHKECLSIRIDVKKTWTCRWHECCACFRKASQCGGHLIHCASCPTSFCFDCFPPDYIRYHAGEDYYYNLRQRGFSATPSSWILYMCSKCKAFATQSKQRELSKADRDHTQQSQREIREEAKQKLRSENDLEMEEKRRSLSEKRLQKKDQMEKIKDFVSRRQTIDAVDDALEMELRAAYSSLFPPTLVDEVNKRSTESLQLKFAIELDLAAQSSTVIENVGGDATQAAANAQKQIEKSVAKKLSGLNVPKSFDKQLVLCDNCRFPCHNSARFPSPCSFPLELTKAMNTSRASEQQPRNEAIVTMNTANPHKLEEANKMVDGKEGENKEGTPEVVNEMSQKEADVDEQPLGVTAGKTLNRGNVCSLCGISQKVKMAHSRKHCLSLTEEQRKEYQERRERMKAFIRRLKNHEGIFVATDNFANFSPAKLKALIHKLTEVADDLMEGCLKEVGLGEIVGMRRPVIPKKPLGNKSIRDYETKEKSFSPDVIDLCSPPASPLQGSAPMPKSVPKVLEANNLLNDLCAKVGRQKPPSPTVGNNKITKTATKNEKPKTSNKKPQPAASKMKGNKPVFSNNAAIEKFMIAAGAGPSMQVKQRKSTQSASNASSSEGSVEVSLESAREPMDGIDPVSATPDEVIKEEFGGSFDKFDGNKRKYSQSLQSDCGNEVSPKRSRHLYITSEQLEAVRSQLEAKDKEDRRVKTSTPSQSAISHSLKDIAISETAFEKRSAENDTELDKQQQRDCFIPTQAGATALTTKF